MHGRRFFGVVIALAMAQSGCGDGGDGGDELGAGAGSGAGSAGSTTVPTTAPTASSTAPPASSTAPSSTALTTSSIPLSGSGQGGLAGADKFVNSLVGQTYKKANDLKVYAHQQSDFGRLGSWTLFTVEQDGHWYAFTTVNTPGAEGVGALDAKSKIVAGERLRDLPNGDWYGVSGVVRHGQGIGGVMMHGRGLERQDDGTFPVLGAWRVNLQSLKLEPTSEGGLDIIEACG